MIGGPEYLKAGNGNPEGHLLRNNSWCKGIAVADWCMSRVSRGKLDMKRWKYTHFRAGEFPKVDTKLTAV